MTIDESWLAYCKDNAVANEFLFREITLPAKGAAAVTGDPRVCEHGSLRRKCPICDSAKDIEELEAQVAQLRATLAEAREGWDHCIAQNWQPCMAERDRLQRELAAMTNDRNYHRESAMSQSVYWRAHFEAEERTGKEVGK